MTKQALDKARALVERNAEWLRLRDPQTGRIVGYGIPTSDGANAYHLASPTRCTCKGFDRRGECSHMSAAIQYVALKQAEAKEAAAQAAALLADDGSFVEWLAALDVAERAERVADELPAAAATAPAPALSTRVQQDIDDIFGPADENEDERRIMATIAAYRAATPRAGRLVEAY